jgi:membrane associated rhomboid family serine protease
MSKKKNKKQKKPDITFSDKELNIISVFGVFISGIAYFVYGWQGLIGGALAGVVMGIFVIRWYREKGKQENQNEIKP